MNVVRRRLGNPPARLAATRVAAFLTALVISVLAALAGTALSTPRAVFAAAPYTVAASVSRGYSGPNIGLNNYRMSNLGAYAAVDGTGESLPVWCIQAHISHSTAAGGYHVAGDNLVDSGALDYLLWRYRSFESLDGAGEAHDRAAAINGLTLFYANSPRNGYPAPVWANTVTGAAITPADSSGHRWNALPQFSLSFPIGMYDIGAANFDRAEQLVDQLYHEAAQRAAPWSLASVSADTVQLTTATGATIADHPVELLDRAATVIGTATTDANGLVTATDPRVVAVRTQAPGTHIELSAGSGTQRLVGGTAAELLAGVAVWWEPSVATQISAQSALPFETITDSLHVSGVPHGMHVDVELELYDLDDDPTGSGEPLTRAVVSGLGDGWTDGHAPYVVRPDQQGARLSYRERWVKPESGERGPWSELGIAAETVTIGRFDLATAVLTRQLLPGDTTVTDRVDYSQGLDPDAGSWSMYGIAVRRADGALTPWHTTAEFRPDPAGGTVDVALPAPVPGDYVVYEQLLLDGRPIATHADLTAESQWFSVLEPEPEPPTTTAPAEPPAPGTEPPTPTEPPTTEPPPTLPPTTDVPPPVPPSGGGGLPATGGGNAATRILAVAALVVAAGGALWLLAPPTRWLRR